MKWKKFACLVAVVALLCGLCGCGAGNSAQNAAQNSAQNAATDDGGSSASTEATQPLPTSKAAYYTPAEAFAGGSGTAQDPYQISTPEELARLREVLDEHLSEYYEASYLLTADIALNDVSDFESWGDAEPAYQWAPIENFSGTFDGDGHTISGLYLFKAGDAYKYYMGLFGDTNTGAVIRDLHLTQTYLFMDGTDSATADVGCLAGSVYGATVENCTVEGVVRVQNGNSYSLGGVVGWAQESTLRGCSFTGKVEGQSFNATFGGVVGTTVGYHENCLLADCVSEGTMRFTDSDQGDIGGVVGSAGGVVRGCVNRMDISGDCDELGGVMGRVSVGAETLNEETVPGSFAAYDCRNEGAVENLAEEAGGVIGIVHNSDARVESLTLSGLVNSGAVTGVERVGGIVGDLNSGCLSYTLENCENTGTVTAGMYAGGIIGYASSSIDGCRISGCTNSGDIQSQSPGGGIVGAYMGMSLALDRTEGLLTFADCRNTGTVENLDGIGGTGGILGRIFTDDEGESVLLTNCENTGTIRSAGPAWLGGILGGPGPTMLGGGWVIRDCQNSGTLSIGSGTRNFAEDASLEKEALQSVAVDPTTMDESDYQASLAERAITALGGSCVGSIAGKLWLGTIEDCTAAGTILLDAEDFCYAGGICGQFYNVGGDNGNLIRNCHYQQGWPFPAMAAIGTLENVSPETIVNVTADLD